jgi:hypothetical protein
MKFLVPQWFGVAQPSRLGPIISLVGGGWMVLLAFLMRRRMQQGKYRAKGLPDVRFAILMGRVFGVAFIVWGCVALMSLT